MAKFVCMEKPPGILKRALQGVGEVTTDVD
jgi:hypothetical protein